MGNTLIRESASSDQRLIVSIYGPSGVGKSRLAESGGRPFTMRPVVLLDTMYPHPAADLTIRLTTPDAVRRARIADRDIDWGTNVAGRWQQLEASRRYLESLPTRDNLILPGDRDPAENAAAIIRRLPKGGA